MLHFCTKNCPCFHLLHCVPVGRVSFPSYGENLIQYGCSVNKAKWQKKTSLTTHRAASTVTFDCNFWAWEEGEKEEIKQTRRKEKERKKERINEFQSFLVLTCTFACLSRFQRGLTVQNDVKYWLTLCTIALYLAFICLNVHEFDEILLAWRLNCREGKALS